jgi:hypothetical protein
MVAIASPEGARTVLRNRTAWLKPSWVFANDFPSSELYADFSFEVRSVPDEKQGDIESPWILNYTIRLESERATQRMGQCNSKERALGVHVGKHASALKRIHAPESK